MRPILPLLVLLLLAEAGVPQNRIDRSLDRLPRSDPGALSASTFLGGAGHDGSWPVTSLAKDEAGNLYVTAKTYSSDFPITAGAYDATYNGGGDVVLAKLDPTLTVLLASTFLGGSAAEQSVDLALDDEGNVYVAGETNSGDFPMTANAFDATKNLRQDLFVAKLDPGLTTLLGATYLGGDEREEGGNLVLNGGGDLFLCGTSASPGFPTTSGAYDETYNGGSPTWSYGDAVVAKLDENLTTLQASTFLGGSAGEYSCSLALGPTGDIFLTGTTESADLPTTPGAYDESFNGELDVYVSRLSADLATLEASTVIGTGEREWGYCITVSATGEVYLAGHGSAGYPTTPGAYDRTYNGGPNGDDDVIVSKLDEHLSVLLASTFLGGDNFENCNAIVLDDAGNVYLAGYSQSSNPPTTPGAFDETANGQMDALAAKLTGDLAHLSACSVLGGPNVDRDILVLLDEPGSVYVSGQTRSTSFPTTNHAFDRSHGGLNDVFLSRLLLTGLVSDRSSFSATTGRTVEFDLVAGAEHAGRVYVLLGSMSGTEPGTPLPGGALLPLNWDSLTLFMVPALNSPLFTDFVGTLDAHGNAAAQLNAPPVTSLAGMTMHYAYALVSPFDFVSNPVPIEIVP